MRGRTVECVDTAVEEKSSHLEGMEGSYSSLNRSGDGSSPCTMGPSWSGYSSESMGYTAREER